jgi:phycobilisome rod-core linker protein
LKTPRYGDYHRVQLGFPQVIWQTGVRRFVPQEQKPKAGDPSLYMNMAREVKPAVNTVSRISLADININTMVPRR